MLKGLNNVRKGKYRRDIIEIIFLLLFVLFVVFWMPTLVVCVFCINVYFHALFLLFFIRNLSLAYHKLKLHRDTSESCMVGIGELPLYPIPTKG